MKKRCLPYLSEENSLAKEYYLRYICYQVTQLEEVNLCLTWM